MLNHDNRSKVEVRSKLLMMIVKLWWRNRIYKTTKKITSKLSYKRDHHAILILSVFIMVQYLERIDMNLQLYREEIGIRCSCHGCGENANVNSCFICCKVMSRTGTVKSLRPFCSSGVFILWCTVQRNCLLSHANWVRLPNCYSEPSYVLRSLTHF